MSSKDEQRDSDCDDVNENLVMSRTECVEITTNLADIENMTVVDEWGRKVRFGDFYMNQKTIVIFVRHFLCFICKEYMDDLALVPKAYLEEAGVRLVVIGCAPHKFIEQFRQTTGYTGELYTDPERHLYNKLGLLRYTNKRVFKESRHVKSNMVTGVFKSMWRGMKFREFQGDMNQQGGAFICGPGNTIEFSHVDANATDHCLINDLLAKSGVQQVNFAKDTRVMSI